MPGCAVVLASGVTISKSDASALNPTVGVLP